MRLILLCLVLYFLNPYNANAQKVLTLSSTTMHGSKVIQPTWDNFTELLFADNTSFELTMHNYEYTYTDGFNSYMAKNDKAVFFYTISKNSKSVIMMFNPDDGSFTSSFKNDLVKKLNHSTAVKDGMYEIYKTNFYKNGILIRLKIEIKEDFNNDLVLIAFNIE